MKDTASFGYWVRRWRKALDLTQAQLAEQIACAVVTIKKIESDERRPSQQMAERLAICLHIPETQRTKFVQVAIREKPVYTLYLPEKPISTPTKPRTGSKIPAPPTRLIGRRSELEAIKDCVRRADVRLVTLSGPGGVGKTRLAVQVAQELISNFKDGVFFVSLAPLGDPDLVAATIAQSIDLHQTPGKSLEESLCMQLTDREILLLLDNFEYLLPAGMFVSELLKSTSRLKILSTSRTPLHLYGERRFILQPFDLPDQSGDISDLEQNDAISLFVERAQAVRYDFKLTSDNVISVAQICHRLDGLPLAIELAAARMNVLLPQELVKHLETRLPLLTDGPRDVPPRHQTLTNTISWSHDLLNQNEKTLLERMSVFRGGGTLEAIESVCPDMQANTTIDAMSALVDHSLLQRYEINRELRFTMLETIREFAAECLKNKDQAELIQQRHLAYYLNLARRAEPELTGKDEPIWLDRLEVDLDNIRTALNFGLRDDASFEIQESAALLAGMLWYFWYSHGLSHEGSEWSRRALACASAKNEIRAKVLSGTGSLLWAQDYREEARGYLDEAISLFRKFNDLHGLAEATHIMGHVELDSRNHNTAKKWFANSLALYQELGDDQNASILIKDMGTNAYILGEYAIAKSYYEESLAWARSQQIVDMFASNLIWLGDLERVSNSYKQAINYYRQALQLSNEVGIPLAIATALHRLGQVALYEENAGEAQNLFLDSLKLRHECGNRYGTAECLAGLAGVAVLNNELEPAAKLLGAAQALLESIGTSLLPAESLAWERTEQSLRAQLPGDTLKSIWETGYTMPLEKLLDGLMS